MMKKSLISKIALALVLVSALTQAFGMGFNEINDYFEGKKGIKKAFTIGSSLLATAGIAATLGLIQAKINLGRADWRGSAFHPELNIILGLFGGFIAGVVTHKVPAVSVYSLFGIGAAGLAFLATNYAKSIATLK